MQYFFYSASPSLSEVFESRKPNCYKCDLQGSQGKPIALGANSNARTHQPSLQIQDRQRTESPITFIEIVAICDNQAWFEFGEAPE